MYPYRCKFISTWVWAPAPEPPPIQSPAAALGLWLPGSRQTSRLPHLRGRRHHGGIFGHSPRFQHSRWCASTGWAPPAATTFMSTSLSLFSPSRFSWQHCGLSNEYLYISHHCSEKLFQTCVQVVGIFNYRISSLSPIPDIKIVKYDSPLCWSQRTCFLWQHRLIKGVRYSTEHCERIKSHLIWNLI